MSRKSFLQMEPYPDWNFLPSYICSNPDTNFYKSDLLVYTTHVDVKSTL